MAYIFSIYKDKKSEYRWRFYSGNMKTMADSGEGYATKKGCQDAIATLQKEVAGATVVDISDKT